MNACVIAYGNIAPVSQLNLQNAAKGPTMLPVAARIRCSGIKILVPRASQGDFQTLSVAVRPRLVALWSYPGTASHCLSHTGAISLLSGHDHRHIPRHSRKTQSRAGEGIIIRGEHGMAAAPAPDAARRRRAAAQHRAGISNRVGTERQGSGDRRAV